MCEPATIFTILGTATAIGGQIQQAKAQASYQVASSESARLQGAQQMSAIRIRESQEKESVARQQLDAEIEGRKARATAKTIAGESGVSGNSIDALVGSLAASEGRYKNALQRQQDFISAGAATEVKGVQTNISNQLVGINQPIRQPNYLAAALRIGSSLYTDPKLNPGK